jgi:hypothetical protein
VVLAYGRFLHFYERLETRIESELDHAYGCRLSPALMVFYVQLNIHNWAVCQVDVADTECLTPPEFCQGLHVLEVQNNIMWYPTVTNVPALFAVCVTTRVLTGRASTPVGAAGSGSGSSGAGVGSAATPSAAVGNAARRDPGSQVGNPNRDARFVGNTPFA